MCNDIIFNGKTLDFIAILDLIRTCSWIWHKAKYGAYGYSYSSCCICLIGCIRCLW